jgi:subtilisin family serine protease
MRSVTPGLAPRAAVAALVLVSAGCVDGTMAPEPARVPSPAFSAMAAEGAQLRNHVIVLGEEAAPPRSVLDRIAALGGTVQQRWDVIGVLTASGLSDAAAGELAALAGIAGVAQDFDVQWIRPLEQVEVMQLAEIAPETDQSGAFFFPFQWNMRQIKADDAWLVTPQGKGALACVLDTGVDPTHIDLAGKINFAKSVSFFPGEPDILDRNAHGTFVTALVGSNGLGMASVAPDADLCMIKIAGADGSAPFEAIIGGFIWAALVRADVANISFGALIPAELLAHPLVVALQRAISFAFKNDVLVVASAGNDALKIDFGSPVIHIPAGLKGVLSVGATAPVNQKNFDQLASYTNYGRAGVHVMAPGGDLVPGGVIFDLVLSACSTIALPTFCPTPDFYLLGSGTSFSAPHATGAAAVIESTAKLDQGAAFLRQCIVEGADRIDGRPLSIFYGRGRINVLKSVMIDFCGGVKAPDDGGPTT